MQPTLPSEVILFLFDRNSKIVLMLAYFDNFTKDFLQLTALGSIHLLRQGGSHCSVLRQIPLSQGCKPRTSKG
jgi:hypothetical protein